MNEFNASRWVKLGLYSSLILALLAGVAVSGVAGAELLGPGYKLSPGDALQVEIFGSQEMSGVYTVGPAGTITLPQLGQVYLRNMTVEEARAHLTERLGELLRFPHVVLSIREMESVRKVYVSGYVTNQGALVLPFGATVVDAIVGAGTTDLSDLKRVRVTHPGEEGKILDLSGLRTDQPIDITERVQYGDVIYMPKVRDRVAILGYVEQPGTVYLPVGEELRVLEAITRVAGGLSVGADRSSALLIHEDQASEVIDLNRLIRQGDVAENVVLRSGDVLVVHEAASISVVGEVTNPTTFRTGEPMTVLEALAQAQGFTPQAALASARIHSKQGEVRPVNLKALWEEGDLSQNVELSPGDILVVPEAEPETILLVGAVEKPGVLDIAHQKERDLLRVVTLAIPSPLADLRRVTIYRDDKPRIVDLQAVMDEGKLAENIDVAPGDVVMVPEKETLYVLGAVGLQGKIAWEPDMSILDVLALTGGITDRARADAITIVRIRPDKTWEHITVSVAKLQQGIPPEPVVLKPADIIYVPAKGVRRSLFTQIRDILWTLGSIATIYDVLQY